VSKRQPAAAVLDASHGFKAALQDKSRQRRTEMVHLPAASAPARNDLLPALQLNQLSLDSLKAPQRSLRKLDRWHVQEIAGSIRTLGFSCPGVPSIRRAALSWWPSLRSGITAEPDRLHGAQ
jgi:hypothetical protein